MPHFIRSRSSYAFRIDFDKLLTVGCWRRGGFEAEKLSPRTKVVGRIHFPKLQNSHEAKTVLDDTSFDYCGGNLTISCQTIKVFDQNKKELTIEQFGKICKNYWDEWSKK
jgi:hypothetical protein